MLRHSFTAIAAAAFLVAAPAYATELVIDSGWQNDTLPAEGVPTENSPWTFTITTNAVLSVVDCCVVGDVYTLSGDLSGVTTFYAGSPTDVQAEGAYAFEWLSDEYSKIALEVGPGTYTFTIVGDGVGGVPAGLGVRLDSVDAAVPEPASWAMMIAGFGLIGGAMRRRTATVSYAV